MNKWYVLKYVFNIRRAFESLFQFPFMYLSANEIDVSFQYRYANQVRPMLFRLEGNEG